MGELRLRVLETTALTAQVRTLELAAENGGTLPGFTAGAHIRVTLPDGTDRHYSLVNTLPDTAATAQPATYRLGIRLEEDGKGGSRHMHGLAAGDVIDASLPRNDFALADTDAPVLLIAGGIGVTPLISMASELKAKGRPFAFHYAGRSRVLLAFVDELAAIDEGALTIHCDDEPETCIDLKALIGRAPAEGHIYVCGPRGMIEAVREIAHARGIAKDHVHFELFDAPKAETGDQPFEVEISSTGQVFTVPPGKSIIEVLEAEGVDLIYDCQRGDCGICQTAVIEGIPDHRDVILTDDERAANDVMQICVSRAKSSRLVLDL
ncbi:PDR/VanB family oxidoreductase [Nitratireductor pacificus]|uniref:Vanillate O-demethylase oxidoreductase n=1 Tax=Nitratireductor pacificus pht-3B TaxID=391937 RepID=K2M7G6_9HYPH|nr:PDR/VanB family oxidoreductase [Nitratireductor pacificus]EKF18121.1 vanillate O-demethylase oxidoreductase [Nitratireductor pacificus pht-3B]